MAYLAVNKDGTEIISEYSLYRMDIIIDTRNVIL